VTSAAELADACRERFDACDVLLMAAAVADFRPASPAAGKLKKDGLQTPRAIELEPTADVLATLAARRSPGQVLVGFAAEHGPEGLANARAKLERKGLDAIVLNDVSQDGIGFDSPDNEVTIITADGQERPVARASKERVAEEVCDVVVALRERRRREADGSGRAPAADVSRA
jgi:phosphopantothenoylcysteine decarboxylase/phosphopantothenate--cysteine ligase